MTVEAVTKEETEIEIAQIIEAGTTVEAMMIAEEGMTVEVVMTAEEGMTVEAVTTEIPEEKLIRAMTGLVASVAM